MLEICAGYFCFKKIRFVALAIKINSRIFELSQNFMHFVKKGRDNLNYLFIDHLKESQDILQSQQFHFGSS